ncbi:MAG: DNA starvation/stationary phase protection protein [Alphaproteobacteria bacterium]|nr:DNA starvation/stationary phase protection protein [Alphaproteobacteria bacterium]
MAKSAGIDIGISTPARKDIAGGLSHVLADTYTLYLKTHNYHWNVTGPQFNDLHAMFMVQYTELWNAVDLIAERIRSLGHFAPGTYKAFADLTSIKEEETVPNANTMLENLLAGHETVARTCRDAFPAADKVGDQPTMDLLTQRMQVHEKTAWMLRSILGR